MADEITKEKQNKAFQQILAIAREAELTTFIADMLNNPYTDRVVIESPTAEEEEKERCSRKEWTEKQWADVAETRGKNKNPILTIGGIEIDYHSYEQIVRPGDQTYPTQPLIIKQRDDGFYYIHLEHKAHPIPENTMSVGYINIPFETKEAADEFYTKCHTPKHVDDFLRVCSPALIEARN